MTVPQLTKPKSFHTSDPLLQPFLSSTFSPTAYLNATLPALSISSITAIPKPSIANKPSTTQTLSLKDLTTQTQTQIAQLSAQTTRLSETLTSLTDDILRSGSRLVYEVEVLRGETVSLAEALSKEGSLNADIEKFVPGGLKLEIEEEVNDDTTPKEVEPGENAENATSQEPPVLASLRTLHTIRTRLQSVIQIFDFALSWPLPPSSLTSSLVTITSTADAEAEEKGQQALQRLRDEIKTLLDLSGEEGIEKAEARIEELRALVGVWSGTGEEKVRAKFVEGLGRGVGERRREWEAKNGRGSLEKDGPSRVSIDGRPNLDVPVERRGTPQGGGFFRRLRDEIYLD
ncbi:MAG: hypothetical protein MMC33_009465 [Icmadophila ericetorum]|nr:hypothetical protein [Icmadophila ericetorum]